MSELGGQVDERAMLEGFLDWNRAVVVNKVTGLSRTDATKTMTPSGLSPLGVIAHLAAVEVGWFAEAFAGEPEDPSWEDHWSFRIKEQDSIESVIDEYRAACERSRAVVAATTSLDQLSADRSEVYGHVTLRWVLLHILEETARHAGHLDIMREAIDGQTGS